MVRAQYRSSIPIIMHHKTVTVIVILGICACTVEAILTSGNATGDQLIAQQSSPRSSVYGGYGYYTDDFHRFNHDGYGVHNYGQGHDDHGYHHVHPQPHDHHQGGLHALLLPLAGVALLGAAAALVSNPVLLQLGVVSGRRRRDISSDRFQYQKMQDLLLMDKFLSRLPREEVARQERQLVASYLECSGASCVERLVCELNLPTTTTSSSQPSTTEKLLMDRVISKITNNEYVSEKLKKNLIRARKIANLGESCSAFFCPELDKANTVVKS